MRLSKPVLESQLSHALFFHKASWHLPVCFRAAGLHCSFPSRHHFSEGRTALESIEALADARNGLRPRETYIKRQHIYCYISYIKRRSSGTHTLACMPCRNFSRGNADASSTSRAARKLASSQKCNGRVFFESSAPEARKELANALPEQIRGTSPALAAS